MTHTIEKYEDICNFSGVTSVTLPFMNLKYVGTLAPTAKIIGDIPNFNVLNVPKTQPLHNPALPEPRLTQFCRHVASLGPNELIYRNTHTCLREKETGRDISILGHFLQKAKTLYPIPEWLCNLQTTILHMCRVTEVRLSYHLILLSNHSKVQQVNNNCTSMTQPGGMSFTLHGL